MLSRIYKYKDFRAHPLLSDLESVIFSNSKEKNVVYILKNCIRFSYPKTFIFSFCNFPSNYKLNNQAFSSDSNIYNNIGSSDSDINMNDREVEDITNNDFSNFVDIFLNYIDIRNISPLFIFDLRHLRVFDEGLFLSIYSKLVDRNMEPLVLSTESISTHIRNVFTGNMHLFSTEEEMNTYIVNLFNIDRCIYNLKLSGIVTLRSLEKIFTDLEFEDSLKYTLTIHLDMSNVIKLSTFSTAMINVIVHSISHRYGVRWKIIGKNNVVENMFLEFRMNLANYDLFENGDPIIRQTSSMRDTFGIYTFDGNHQSKLLKDFDSYIENMRSYYPILNDMRPFTYDYKDSPRITRLPIAGYISMIAYELVDNISLHAKHKGYFLAKKSKNGFLYLFIGDCGVGLRKGILNVYDLEKELTDDKSSIAVSFKLNEYNERRYSKDFAYKYKGFGLRDTLAHIFLCEGKFLYRTGNVVGSFVNPVKKVSAPSKVIDSSYCVDGIQYLIIIPLTQSAINNMPSGTDDFLGWEE